MLTELATDFHLALRTLAKARGFTGVVVVTLALGIALNVTVLAVANAYLIRSLPYPGASRLYNIVYAPPGQPSPRGLETLPWETLSDVIEHGIAWDLDMFYLIGGERPESAPGAWVTPGFMEGLGVRPAIGRAFSGQDYQPNSPQVALISHSLWRNRFGGEPQITGRRFHAYVSDRPDEAEAFTIIGVLPERFWHVNPYTEVLAPLRAPTYPYMARLRSGVPASGAERILAKFVRQGALQVPENWKLELRSTHDLYVATVRPLLKAVSAATALVLLIACVNVAFLMLIRSLRRQKEIAVRLALGARRMHIARLMIAEALILATAATVAGAGLSGLAIKWIAPMVQRQLGRPAPGGADAITFDATVLATAGGFCLLTAILFTLVPLAAAWRTGIAGAMHHGRRMGADSRANRRLHSGLIALEIAGSLSLLAGCGLMVRTTIEILNVDLGYRAQHVLTGNIGLRQRSYPDDTARAAFYGRMLPRLAQIPGVESAAFSSWWVLHQPRLLPVETEVDGRRSAHQTSVLAVSPDYFSALGIPVAAGRPFGVGDRIGAEPVALVSETLAGRLWPCQSPIGKRVLVNGVPMGTASSRQWTTVIGVVGDVRQSHSDTDLSDLYVPLLQAPGRFASLYLRTAGPAASWLSPLRDAIKKIDHEIALNRPNPWPEILEEQISRPRFLAGLLAVFAALAMTLATLGMYGVIAYGVRQREHEIAVRMSLGAAPASVTGLFLRQGAWLLSIGVTGGLLLAAAIGRMLESQLFGVRPGDPAVLGIVTGIFSATGLAAVWFPARKAARTEPAIALREE
jgi:putative ABC transport system permease protein